MVERPVFDDRLGVPAGAAAEPLRDGVRVGGCCALVEFRNKAGSRTASTACDAMMGAP